jgi:Family of unknown function (DUF5398)
MFGLKKEDKKPIFEFDLEKELKDDKKLKLLMQKAEKQILEIKGILRKGAKEEDFEKLGLLLHGYSALLKTISNVTTK